MLLVGARGVGVRVFGLLGNVALARLLVPSEFGKVALALSVLMVGSVLLDGGLGASLIRRKAEPSVEDLRSVLAVQLLGAVVLGAGVAGTGLWLGGAGEIAALVMLALPLVAVRGPRMILLYRRLAFGTIAAAEVGEVLAYYVWAVTTVALGFGVWGLASASLVKALVGTAVVVRLGPSAPLRPAWSTERIRSLLHFGLRVQGVDLLRVLRDQGLIAGTFAIAGASTLGLWVIATRVLQVPLLLFESLWGVSFPAMSQVLASGEDPKPLMEKAVRVIAATTGLIATVLVCAAPALMPGVFGPSWTGATGAVAVACIGLQIGSPISSVASGYLLASEATGAVVRSSLAQALIWPAVSLPLLPVIGVTALGLGCVAAGIVEALILSTATRRMAGAELLRPVLLPLAITLAVSGAGWLVVSAASPNLLTATIGALGGAALYVVILGLVQRDLLMAIVDLVRRGLSRIG